MRTAPIIVGLVSSVAAFAIAARISSEMPRHVDVGDGTFLRMHVEGRRGPVLVLEMETDERMRARLAQFARVVDYNRAGWGDSVASGPKRDADQIAQELHTALGNFHLDPPYILVGDTVGSLFVRRFAQMFPKEVGGVVLLDPVVEEEAPGATLGWLKANRPDTYKQFQQIIQENGAQAGFSLEWIRYVHAVERMKFEQLLGKAAPEQRKAWLGIVDRRLQTEESSREIYAFIKGSVGSELNEFLAFEDTFRQLRTGGPLPAVPIQIITSRGRSDGVNPDEASFDRAEHEYMRQRQAGLIANVATGEHLTTAMALSDPDYLVGVLEKLVAKTSARRP